MAATQSPFSEAVEAKAHDLLAAGCVRKHHGDWPTWKVKGGTGEYTVRWWTKRQKWSCDCPANGARCSHIKAVQLSLKQPVAIAPPQQKETKSMASNETKMVTAAPLAQGGSALGSVTSDTIKSMREEAEILLKSGFMPKHLDTPEKIIVTAMVASELGIPKMYGFSKLYPVDGKVTMMGELMLALVKRSGKYGYRFVKATEDEAVFELWPYAHPDEKYTASATMAFAKAHKWDLQEWWDKQAGQMKSKVKQPWVKFPGHMLKWRCVSDAIRVVCPEIIAGMYTPEELGADVWVNDEGSVEVVAMQQHDAATGEVATATATPTPPKPRARAKKAPEAPPAPAVEPEPIEGVFDAQDAPTGTVERLEDLADGDETEADAPAANEDGVVDAELIAEDQPWFQYGPTGGPGNEQMLAYMVEQGLWDAADGLDLPEEENGADEETGEVGGEDPLALTEEEEALCKTGTAGDISKWIGEHKAELNGTGRDALKEMAGHGDKTWAQVQKDEHREEIFTMILTVAKAKMQEGK